MANARYLPNSIFIGSGLGISWDHRFPFIYPADRHEVVNFQQLWSTLPEIEQPNLGWKKAWLLPNITQQEGLEDVLFYDRSSEKDWDWGYAIWDAERLMEWKAPLLDGELPAERSTWPRSPIWPNPGEWWLLIELARSCTSYYHSTEPSLVFISSVQFLVCKVSLDTFRTLFAFMSILHPHPRSPKFLRINNTKSCRHTVMNTWESDPLSSAIDQSIAFISETGNHWQSNGSEASSVMKLRRLFLSSLQQPPLQQSELRCGEPLAYPPRNQTRLQWYPKDQIHPPPEVKLRACCVLLS